MEGLGGGRRLSLVRSKSSRKNTKFWVQNLKRRDYMGYAVLGGRLVLK
jgi:hypothetical protein